MHRFGRGLAYPTEIEPIETRNPKPWSIYEGRQSTSLLQTKGFGALDFCSAAAESRQESAVAHPTAVGIRRAEALCPSPAYRARHTEHPSRAGAGVLFRSSG